MTKTEALMMLKAWQASIDPLKEDLTLDKRFATLEVACKTLEQAIAEEQKDGKRNRTYKERLELIELWMGKFEYRLTELEKKQC